MSELTTIARPYAQAVFDLAHQHDMLGAWSDMLHFAAAVADNATMREAIDSPSLTVTQLADMFIQVCGEHLDDQGKNFIRLLTENDRLLALPEVAAQFDMLRAEAEGTVEATVFSAHPLTDAQQASLTDALKKRYGRDVTLDVEIDSTLLGGAVIQAGDEVIDGSLRGKLERFAGALA